MATFRQRKSGWWQAIIRRKGHQDESKTFEKRAEAEVWAKTIESEIGRGVYTSALESERTTLGDLIKRFRQEFAPHHYRLREDKQEAWRHQCDRLEAAMGAYSLAAIDQRLVAQYRDDRMKGNEQRKAVSASTVRKELYMLSKLLGFAETECGIALPRGNPVERIRKPTEGRSRERRLDAKEWGKLETQCQRSRNPWLWPAMQLATETAMRQGEMLQLTWRNVDLKRRIVFLRDPDKLKNEEPRAVPLTKAAGAVLKALPHSVEGKVLPVERMTLYHAFAAAVARAGIKDFTFHDLRHEALSRLAERGDLSLLEMAAVSGHKTLQMLKRYTHLQAEKLAKKLG